MRAQRYDEAVVYLQAALASARGGRDAGAPAARSAGGSGAAGRIGKRLAFCFARTGQYGDAVRLLESLAESGHMGRSLVEAETGVIRALGQARALAAAGQHDAAADLLAPLVQRTCPATQAHLDAAVELGHARVALSQFAQAADAYAQAEASGQTWAYGEAALVKHMRSLVECKRAGDAVALFEAHTGTPLDPAAAELRQTAADAYVAHAAAALALAEGLTVIGRHVVASKALASGYSRLAARPPATDGPHAARVLKRLAHVQTALAKLWLAAGQSALDRGDTPAATECFQRLATECPHADAATRFEATKVRQVLEDAARKRVAAVFTNALAKGDYAAAAAELHQIAEELPYTRGGMQAHYYEGKCLRNMGKRAQAKAIFERHLKRYPGSDMVPTVCYMVGQSHLQAKSPRQALKSYAYALESRPDAPNADMCAFLIAVHFWGTKDYKRCAHACQTVLEDYPKSRLASRAKAMLHYIGRTQKGRARR